MCSSDLKRNYHKLDFSDSGKMWWNFIELSSPGQTWVGWDGWKSLELGIYLLCMNARISWNWLFPCLWSVRLFKTNKTIYNITNKKLNQEEKGHSRYFLIVSSVQFNSVTQSCPTLCDPMNCSTPGLPVHHQLPEFTQKIGRASCRERV